MSIHQRNSTVTFKWTILPTGSPPVAADFDILLILPDFQGSYTDDNITSYVAPTATTQGQVTFDLPLPQLGRYIVKLATGVSTALIVNATREIYAVDLPPHILLGAQGKLTQGPEIARRIVRAPTGSTEGDPDWANIQIYGVGYDGDDTVVVSAFHNGTGEYRVYVSGADLLTPTEFNMTGITGWTSGIFQLFQWIEYSTTLSRWVAYTGRGKGFYCDGDPSVGANWTEITYPTNRPSMGAFTNVRLMQWSPLMQMFVTFQDGNSNDTAEVSVDGITWYLWSDYQTFTTNPNKIANWFEGEVSGTTRILSWGTEDYKHRTNTTGAGTLPGAAQGWSETTANGVIQNTSTSNIYACATDGDVVAVINTTTINCSDLLLSHPDAWGPDGNANKGWLNTDMGFAASSGTFVALMYLPQYTKPWKLFRTSSSTPDINNHGWWETADIPYPGATQRVAGNAPTWNYIAADGDEPFASLNTAYMANSFHFPGNVQVGIGAQWTQAGSGSQGRANFGTDGWYVTIRTDISRLNDYLVFQKPSTIE